MARTTSGSQAPSGRPLTRPGSSGDRRCRARWVTRRPRCATSRSSQSTPTTTSSGCEAVCPAARAPSSGSGRWKIRMAKAQVFDARAGDAKSPIRQGGGTWGGPKAKPPRYGKRINRKEATAAFDGALSAKAQDGELYVLDSLAFDAPSTKRAKELLSRMELEGPMLVVLTESDANAALSFRNLPRVSVVGPHDYGVYELLRAREVVFSRAANSRLAGKES